MSQATIIQKARLIPRDFGEQFEAEVTGDGNLMQFSLPAQDIDATTFSAMITSAGPPVTLTPAVSLNSIGSTQYWLDDRIGVITLGVPLAIGATLRAEGVGNMATMSGDLSSFVDIAFDMHTKGRNPPATMDTLSPTEEYLVALLATVQSLWAQAAEAAQEVDVTTPEGMHIPAGQRFQQILALLERIEAHYKEMSSLLGVGLYAIQMFTLRRISRTTNKYVPLYRPQEFDDTSTPVRLYPPIDSGV